MLGRDRSTRLRAFFFSVAVERDATSLTPWMDITPPKGNIRFPECLMACVHMQTAGVLCSEPPRGLPGRDAPRTGGLSLGSRGGLQGRWARPGLPLCHGPVGMNAGLWLPPQRLN